MPEEKKSVHPDRKTKAGSRGKTTEKPAARAKTAAPAGVSKAVRGGKVEAKAAGKPTAGARGAAAVTTPAPKRASAARPVANAVGKKAPARGGKAAAPAAKPEAKKAPARGGKAAAPAAKAEAKKAPARGGKVAAPAAKAEATKAPARGGKAAAPAAKAEPKKAPARGGKAAAPAAKAEAKKAPARGARAAAPAAKPEAKKAPARGGKAAAPTAMPEAKKAPARGGKAAAPAAKPEATKAPARGARAAAPAEKPEAKKAPARGARAAAPAAMPEAKKAPARGAKAAAPAEKAEAKKAPARGAKAAAPAAKAEAKKAPVRGAKAATPAAKAEAKKAPARGAKAAAPAVKPEVKRAPARGAKAAAPAAKPAAAKPAAAKPAAAKPAAAKPAAAKPAAAKPAAAKPAAAKPAAAKPAAAKPAAAKPAAAKPAAAKPAAAKPAAAKPAAAAPAAARAAALPAAQPAAAPKPREAPAERKPRGEPREGAVERKSAGRQRAEAERAASVERKAAGRRKVEAEQQAAADRKVARREKVEAEQQAAADRRAARRERTPGEPAGDRQRRGPRQPEARGKPATDRVHFDAATAPEPTRLPPTPIAEAPVEGKGRHAVVDPLAVARLLGDAADLETPLSETLPPIEPAPGQEPLSAAELRRVEREQRAAERGQRHADRRTERKRDREAAAELAEPRPVGEITGTITVRPEGYGFLKRQEGPPGEDIFLPPDELVGVMDGDRLKVRIVRGKFGRDAGQLLEVINRRRRHLLGTFYRRGRTTYVVPVDPTLPRFVSVRGPDSLHDGQVVKVAITQYPEPGVQQLLGDVEKVVGNPDDPLVEVLEVAYANGFAEDFPADVREESEQIPEEVQEGEKAGRRDLSGMRLLTIDGADARDFDDAVHIERREGGGFRLVVAIADVAHYVRPGTRLNEEALHRSTSVYFPNHVLPMLPERLSNGICSLNPNLDRLCMVADVNFDSAGRPVDADVYEGVMNSHARCTYEQVAEILEGKALPELDHVRDDLLLAGELALKLRKQRIDRGALDFDLPEAKPVLDDEMHVVEIVRRPRNDAHRLIEEFMLAANEAVARYFGHRGLPTVYRVHGAPDPAKLENFVALAQAVGFQFDLAEGITPVRLGAWLRQIEGTPQQKALNTLLLRSMMQAIYTPENIGHFGLGSEHYLHFTSPIRRYPDLIVHRLLKEHWARGSKIPEGQALDQMETGLEEIAAHSSLRERAAMEAEREIDAYFKCLFVQDKVGEIFGATIVSITDFGFFAEMDDFPIEGLVRAEELGTAWELDLRQHRLVFGSGLSFGVGEHVQVEIAGVDLLKRQIGLVLVTDQTGEEVLPFRPRAWGKGQGGGAPQRGGGKPGDRGGRSGDRDRGGRSGDRGGGGGDGGGGARSGDRGGGGGRGGRSRDGGRPGGDRGLPAEGGGKPAGGLTDAIDRVRSQQGRAGPAPREPLPAERRGSRFAAGDRQAAWGPRSQGDGAGTKPDGDGRGGKPGKKQGKKHGGRKPGRGRR